MVGLLFAIATAFFWGLYGPALGKARTPGETPFKPYVFIGLAYLIWGMLGGIVAVKAGGDTLTFKPAAINWGFIAGSLGAFGALTLTFAMFKAKDASLVMPIVFGGATSVAAITGVVMQKGEHHLDPRQIAGFVMVVVGVVLIQMYAAHGPAPSPTSASPDLQSEAPPESGAITDPES